MVAKEMEIPWRSAEAMHWKLGEQDMARRAGVTPFSMSAVALDTPPNRRRQGSSGRSSASPGTTGHESYSSADPVARTRNTAPPQ